MPGSVDKSLSPSYRARPIEISYAADRPSSHRYRSRARSAPSGQSCPPGSSRPSSRIPPSIADYIYIIAKRGIYPCYKVFYMQISQSCWLTRDAVSTLMGRHARREEFVVQVLAVLTRRGEEGRQRQVLISDGFTWLKGRVVSIEDGLANYDVVSFVGKDFERSTDSHSFLLKNIKIVTSKVGRVIGKPIHFPDYAAKRAFITAQGLSFEVDQYITIRKVKLLPLGKVTGRVLARVVKIPSNVDKVMNIMLEDEEDTIQCCIFGTLATTYHRELIEGKWYLFESPYLQRNHCKENELELKIKTASKIKLADKQTQIPKKKQQPQKTRSKSEKKQERSCKQFSINEQYCKEDLVFVIARPLYEHSMKEGLGRAFGCVDRFGNKIEILLWSECSYPIQINSTYRFDGLKVKVYNQKVSLQSQRQATSIEPSDMKILSRGEMESSKAKERRKWETSTNKAKQLGKNDAIFTIGYLLQKCEKYDSKILLVIVEGYLTADLSFYFQSEATFPKDVKKKIFYFQCNSCAQNEYNSRGEPSFANGAIICLNCNSKNVKILWNLKANLQDAENTLPCQINSEIVEKITDVSPSQGMILFLQNPTQVIQRIRKAISFKRGVYKVSCKRKEDRNGQEQRYFNICEYYSFSQILLVNQAVDRLKQLEESYKKEMEEHNHSRSKNLAKRRDISHSITDTEYENEPDSPHQSLDPEPPAFLSRPSPFRNKTAK